MATFQEIMEGYGYFPQKTPAGQVIMVNPNFYPMSEEDLAGWEDYADFLYSPEGEELYG